MDSSIFRNLLSQLDENSFPDEFRSVIRSYLQYWFSGQQVKAVLKKLTFDSDQTEALEMISPRMTYITGPEGKAIVNCFTHDKVTAVRLIANRINDPVNKYAVLDAIDFHFDKQDCRKILDSAVPSVAGGGCGLPPTSCGPTGGCQQGYPAPGALPTGTYPQGQIGIPGVSMNFNPGGFGVSMSMQPPASGGPNYRACPPGQQAPYPAQQYPQQQAGYPPPQAGYPPPQTGYPPPQAGYPPPQAGYPPPQTSYPPPQTGYPPPQTGYPPSQAGYPPPYTGYPPPQTGYPPQQTGYPPPQTGYPPSQTGYPPSQTGYPPPQTGYPPSQTGYPPAQASYPPPQNPPQGGGAFISLGFGGF